MPQRSWQIGGNIVGMMEVWGVKSDVISWVHGAALGLLSVGMARGASGGWMSIRVIAGKRAGLPGARALGAMALWLGLTVGALLGGCAAPTLPLPPPAALLVSSPDPVTGLVTISGEALPGALVSAVNVRLESGVIVRANDAGRFSLQIAAQAGDSIVVWQQIDNDRGPFREVCIDCLAGDR